MNCPSCGTAVSEGTSICPACDHIIDASFLDAGAASQPAADPEEERSTGEAQAPRAARPARPPVSRTRRPVAQRKDTPMEMPEYPQPAKRSADFVPPRNWADPEVVIEEARNFIRALTRADRVAFFAALGVMVSCVLPWKETVTDGEVIGLVCSGIFTFFTGLVCAVAVGLRVARANSRSNPLGLWLAQLLSAASGTLWSIAFMPLNYDNTLVSATIGNTQVAVSRPSYGAVLGVVLSGLAVGGTLMSLKERR